MDFTQPEAPVEHIVWQGRSALYKAAVVVTCSNGICTIKLLKAGTQVSCHVTDLRPPPPDYAVGQPLVLQQGGPVDMYETGAGAWRAMVSMQPAAVIPGQDQTIHLQDPGTLDIFKYHNPVLRRGLVYMPDDRVSPWQARPVKPACHMIACKWTSTSPWDYPGVVKPPRVLTEAAAAAGVYYRFRTNKKRKSQGRLNMMSSPYQAVAARTYDLYMGIPRHFTDSEWQQVKEHLGLSPEEEPRLLPEEEPRLLPGGDDEELALLAELAKMAGRNQAPAPPAAAAGAGAKRGRADAGREVAPLPKHTTMQHMQHLQRPAAGGKGQGAAAAGGSSGGLLARGTPHQPQQQPRQQQQNQGAHQQMQAAPPGRPSHPPGGGKAHSQAAAAGPAQEGQASGAAGASLAAPGGLPAASNDPQASLARLSLQQQQQQQVGMQQQEAAMQPAGVGEGSQQLVAGGAEVHGVAAGGKSAVNSDTPAAAAAAAAGHAAGSLPRVSQEHQQALPLQQQPAGGGAGRQLVAGGAGVRGAAAGGSQQAGSSAAVAASGAADQAAAAEPVLGAVQVWGFGQVVVLTLMSLDTVPVRLGAYKLRVVRKLGSGGQGSVWLVELVGGDASGNSIAPGPASPPTAVAGGAGPSGVGSQAPAPSSNPSAAAAAAGAGPPGPAAAATYKPMPQLMAVKVGAPYHVASADRRAGLSQEQYEAHAKQLMANECNLVAKCGECKFIVDTYGWGTLHLSFPPLKQQQPPPGAAAAASGSSAGPIVVELPAMLLEFAEHGSVADQLRSCPPGTGLGERVVKSYLRDVLQALTHMHRFHDICYRDLKPENLLRFPVPPGPLKHRKPLDGQPQNQIYLVKVADLGIAEALTTTGAHYSSNKSYTPAYRAPEIAFTHDLRLDTFGVGCLLVALRSNQDPFFWLDKAPGLSEGEKEARRGAEELAREDCPYRQMLTPHELEFAATCLERDVAKRPYVSQLGLQASYHKYFFWK